MTQTQGGCNHPTHTAYIAAQDAMHVEVKRRSARRSARYLEAEQRLWEARKVVEAHVREDRAHHPEVI